MNSYDRLKSFSPYRFNGILGCNGFDRYKNIVCLVANGGNNYLDAGIVQGTLIFVDTDGTFEHGGLNLFKSDDSSQAQYTLSRNAVPNSVFAGKVIMSLNQHI